MTKTAAINRNTTAPATHVVSKHYRGTKVRWDCFRKDGETLRLLATFTTRSRALFEAWAEFDAAEQVAAQRAAEVEVLQGSGDWMGSGEKLASVEVAIAEANGITAHYFTAARVVVNGTVVHQSTPEFPEVAYGGETGKGAREVLAPSEAATPAAILPASRKERLVLGRLLRALQVDGKSYAMAALVATNHGYDMDFARLEELYAAELAGDAAQVAAIEQNEPALPDLLSEEEHLQVAAYRKQCARIESLEAALAMALPHVQAAASHDRAAMARNNAQGLHGAAAECQKQLDSRRAAIGWIESLLKA
jgi:hypothetical protein